MRKIALFFNDISSALSSCPRQFHTRGNNEKVEHCTTNVWTLLVARRSEQSYLITGALFGFYERIRSSKKQASWIGRKCGVDFPFFNTVSQNMAGFRGWWEDVGNSKYLASDRWLIGRLIPYRESRCTLKYRINGNTKDKSVLKTQRTFWRRAFISKQQRRTCHNNAKQSRKWQ